MMGICYACTAMSQPISGGAMNPTIGFCATTFYAMVKGDGSHLKFALSYIFGPTLSGALAGAFMRYFAIRHTPISHNITGSPFLANKIRKTLHNTNTLMTSS
jgi:hypothetical protein